MACVIVWPEEHMADSMPQAAVTAVCMFGSWLPVASTVLMRSGDVPLWAVITAAAAGPGPAGTGPGWLAQLAQQQAQTEPPARSIPPGRIAVPAELDMHVQCSLR
jgi:hypothetical protein